MAHAFRYPLTRFCLKSGTLTLPRAMVGLFPDSGEAVVVDTVTGEEHSVTVEKARTVAGFGELFRRHQLAVNDELVIEALDDGRFAVTAAAHRAGGDDAATAGVRRVLDELFEAAVPVTEGEVRALFPDLPSDVDLAAAMESDGRFAMRQGRWHNAAAVAIETVGARSVDATAHAVAADEVEPAATRAAVTAVAAHAAMAADATDVASAAAGAGETVASVAGRAASGIGAISQHLGAASTDVSASVQAGLWGGAPDRGPEAHVSPASVPGSDGQHGAGAHESARWSVFERRTPAGTGPTERSQREEADAEEFDDDASLEATELANRLRGALAPLGFRLEPLGRGQLTLHADMGRRGYRVLVQLLSRTERLDWADLLARRRTSGVRYLAVVGDHRDLLRLTNPADLARATLWSWQALDRMNLLHRSVPLSPIELEAHFERDGLFEQGLQRLEATVAQRVAERGALSEVLARLAIMRSPSVFLLEELAGELGMSRELSFRILERLADAPFNLVAKVDAGEFVLRQRVSDALGNVADYASSLRARLPVKQVERLVASGEPDLLTDADDIDHLFGQGGAEA